MSHMNGNPAEEKFKYYKILTLKVSKNWSKVNYKVKFDDKFSKTDIL